MATSSNAAPNEKTYPIRTQRGAYRYRLTCPLDLFEKAGLSTETGTPVGVSVELQDDGRVVLVYSTDTENATKVVTASVHSSGDMCVPSPLAAAMQLGGVEARWEHVEREDGTHELRAITDRVLPNLEPMTSGADLVAAEDGQPAIRPLKHISQEDRNQEDFRVYLNNEETEQVGWDDYPEVAILVARVDGTPALLFSQDTTGVNEKTVKDVSPSNRERGQNDATLYVPNDLVRTMDFVDTEFAWLTTDGDLVLVPYEDGAF